MSQPSTNPHLDELDRLINDELAKDLPGAKLNHSRHGHPATPKGVPPAPPVDQKAGAGAGAWGPTSTSPTMAAQLSCIHDDAQRLIETLQDMQATLALIRGKMGLPG